MFRGHVARADKAKVHGISHKAHAADRGELCCEGLRRRIVDHQDFIETRGRIGINALQASEGEKRLTVGWNDDGHSRLRAGSERERAYLGFLRKAFQRVECQAHECCSDERIQEAMRRRFIETPAPDGFRKAQAGFVVLSEKTKERDCAAQALRAVRRSESAQSGANWCSIGTLRFALASRRAEFPVDRHEAALQAAHAAQYAAERQVPRGRAARGPAPLGTPSTLNRRRQCGARALCELPYARIGRLQQTTEAK